MNKLAMKFSSAPFLSILGIGISLLLVLMPFHAAVVTILGAHTSHKLFLQSWKELLIGVLAFLALIAVIRDRKLLPFDRINIVVLCIVGLSLLVTAFVHPNLRGVLAGIKTNLAVLILFLVAQVASRYFTRAKLTKLILIPAGIVALIALLQPWLFGPSMLARIGYDTSSIAPGQFVELSDSALRVFATLGGPNQLGAYLIIPFALCLTFAVHKKQWWWLLAAFGFTIPLYMTHSRSAWLGAFAAVIIIGLLRLPQKHHERSIAVAIVAVCLVIGAILGSNLCNTNIIGSQLVHGSCINGQLGGSDLQRTQALQTGVVTISQHPFGMGLGSAGPASFYSDTPLVVESWVLQIGIEVGVLGLVLYGLFFVLIGTQLYQVTQLAGQDVSFATALLASFGGILVTGLFLHSLADSTLSIMLFILLGTQLGWRRE